MTRAHLESEQPAIRAWAARHGWPVEVLPTSRCIRASMTHPATGNALTVTADCGGYPSVAPAWRFVDAAGASPKSAYPAAGVTPGISGSIFHPIGLICAPWNRLAYHELGGVHADWGGIVGWKTAARGYTQAHTIADMLHTVMVHLAASPRMMT